MLPPDKIVCLACCYYWFQEIKMYKVWMPSNGRIFSWNFMKIGQLVPKLKVVIQRCKKADWWSCKPFFLLKTENSVIKCLSYLIRYISTTHFLVLTLLKSIKPSLLSLEEQLLQLKWSLRDQRTHVQACMLLVKVTEDQERRMWWSQKPTVKS